MSGARAPPACRSSSGGAAGRPPKGAGPGGAGGSPRAQPRLPLEPEGASEAPAPWLLASCWVTASREETIPFCKGAEDPQRRLSPKNP